MPLEELEKKLYRPGQKEEEVPVTRPAKPAEAPEPGASWGKVERIPAEPAVLSLKQIVPSPETRSKAKRILLIGFMLFAAAAGSVFLYLRLLGAPQVSLAVSGPQEVKAGDGAQYEIMIENLSRGILERTSLTFRAGTGVVFPETPERINIKDLPETFLPGAARREKFTAHFLGKVGDEREIEIVFRYRIANIASEFVKTEKVKVKIAAPAVSINLNLPKQALPNNNFGFNAEWKNLSEMKILYVVTNFEYPQDFEFVDATPKPEEGRAWQFPELPSQETASVSIVGRLKAETGQIRKFKTALGTKVRGELIWLGETESEISIIENPLAMAMSVNGEISYNANPGEKLEYRITFKNSFQETLKDIVITAKLSGRMFDITSVDSQGAYDSRNLTVTFHGGNTPQLLFLDQQEAGSVSFTVKLLNDFPAGLTNNVINVEADITSATRPKYVGLEGTVKAATSNATQVNGILTLTSRVLLRDPSNNSALIGPWPMRQNQTTQMTVRLNVVSRGNEFENIIVKTALPANVEYIGNISGVGSVANPRTKELTWDIPKIGAYQSRELAFRIGVTPSAAQVGSAINVLAQVTIDATDGFTRTSVKDKAFVKRSDDLDDRPEGDGRVQP